MLRNGTPLPQASGPWHPPLHSTSNSEHEIALAISSKHESFSRDSFFQENRERKKSISSPSFNNWLDTVMERNGIHASKVSRRLMSFRERNKHADAFLPPMTLSTHKAQLNNTWTWNDIHIAYIPPAASFTSRSTRAKRAVSS